MKTYTDPAAGRKVADQPAPENDMTADKAIPESKPESTPPPAPASSKPATPTPPIDQSEHGRVRRPYVGATPPAAKE